MKPYLKTTLRYLVYGALWIFFSDMAIEAAVDNLHALTLLQTVKGWLFVGASSALVFFIARRTYLQNAMREKEKLDIYRTTVMGVYHIAFNYINNMHMVLDEAAQSPGFSKDTLRLAQDSGKNATEALKRLRHLDDITPDGIDLALYGEVPSADRTP